MNAFQKMIGASLLIVSLSVAYYFVIFLPKIENEKLSQQAIENMAKETKEKTEKTESRQLLNDCFIDVESAYSEEWLSRCKTKELLSEECLKLVDYSFDDYLKSKKISPSPSADIWLSEYDKFKADKEKCSCLLPKYIADEVNNYKKELKDECFKKYPQN